MKRILLLSLTLGVLVALFFFSFGVPSASAASSQRTSPLRVNCDTTFMAATAVGASAGTSLGTPVSWTCGGGNDSLSVSWGDGTSGNATVGANGSGIYYHTWSKAGNYTINWFLYYEDRIEIGWVTTSVTIWS